METYNVKNIFGFDSQIHNMLPFPNSNLKECWGAKLDTFNIKTIDGKEKIAFTFISNGDEYQVILTSTNDKGDYKGPIYQEEENVGTCFLSKYENPTRTLYWGTWTENGFNWLLLIELI